MTKFDPDLLLRRWTHSHEEDGSETMVFRPAEWRFPPSRGRRSFELRADGSLGASGPGPDDRRVESEGTWRLLEGGVLELDRPNGPWRMHILEAEPDRLVVER
jgi:hypothetical protein